MFANYMTANTICAHCVHPPMCVDTPHSKLACVQVAVVSPMCPGGYYWVVLRTARLDCHFMLMFANYVTGTPSAPTLSIRLLCAAVDEEMWLVVDPTM
eukprot:1270585-Prymnesium_polylepis.1